MQYNDLIQKAAFLFDEGRHTEITGLFQPFLSDPDNEHFFRYCSGLALIMSGEVVTGLSHFAELIRGLSGSSSSDRILFLCFAAMQGALIAEFNLGIDQVLMSSFAEKAASFSKDLAEILGVSDIYNGAANILSRIYYTPSGKPVLVPSSPDILQIEPTNACNLKCIMCSRQKMQRTVGFMNDDLWRGIFDGWSAKNASIVFTHLVLGRKIKFTKPGAIKFFFLGEPLLHPDFDVLIREAALNGCKVSIQTNGSLLYKKDFVSRLINSGVNEIGISFDGSNRDDYAKIRKGADFEKIVYGIRSLIDLRAESDPNNKTKIEISTILGEAKGSEALRAKDFFTGLFNGVDAIRFINLDRAYSPDFISENGDVHSHGKILQVAYTPDSPLCMEPFFKLNILWDGTVTPCCHDIDGEINLGSIKSNTIDEIWRGNKFSRLLQALAYHDLSFQPFCRTCRFPIS